MRLSALLTLSTVLAVALAAPTSPSPHLRRRQNARDYDVIASPDADVPALLDQLRLTEANAGVFARYDNARFRGFSGTVTDDEVAALRAAPGVLQIEPVAPIVASAARGNATWGLQRVSQERTVGVRGSVAARNYTYTWDDDATLGAGVDIYVMDSGVYVEHDEFGGRAIEGFNYFPDQPGDVFGHGTHCAGSAAGSTVGVASNANIISVKVVDDNGGGSSSGYLAGIDYILSRHAERSAQPDFIASVLSLSLLFVGNLQTIDSATSEILDAGIFVSIASGNFRDDACTYSPASLGGANGSAIVVGASDVNDSVSYYSNTGACVDVYAPGSDVVSAAVTGPADVKVDTGTSMAAPHVAGLLAYYVAQNRSIGSPAVAKEYLRETGFAGALALSAAYIGDQVPVLVNNGEL